MTRSGATGVLSGPGEEDDAFAALAGSSEPGEALFPGVGVLAFCGSLPGVIDGVIVVPDVAVAVAGAALEDGLGAEEEEEEVEGVGVVVEVVEASADGAGEGSGAEEEEVWPVDELMKPWLLNLLAFLVSGIASWTFMMNASSWLRESSMLSNAAASLLVSYDLLLTTFMVAFVTASLLIFECCWPVLGDVSSFVLFCWGSILSLFLFSLSFFS